MTSQTGILSTVCCFFTAANAGLSSTRSRTYRPMPTSTMDSRNGIRQPQLLKSSSEVLPCTSLTSPVDSSRPSGTPSCGQLAKKPRRRWLPHSIDISTEPPHSPPTPMPCRIRRITSRIGAAMPQLARPGSRPIRNVAMPMIISVVTRVALRPIRSP